MYPRLLHVYGPVWVTGYGVAIALGLAVFFLFAYQQLLRKHLVSHTQFFDLATLGILGGLIGGKVLFLIQSWPPDPGYSLFEVLLAGFAIHGALLGALVALVFGLRQYRLPVLKILDITAMYAPIAQGIARWGCLLAGCCYGKIALNSSWWTIVYRDPACLAPLHVPLYPTQIFMSLASFGVFFVLRYIVYPLSTDQPGVVVGWYFLLVGAVRFYIDFLRGDRVIGSEINGIVRLVQHNVGWSFYQQIAVLLILGASAYLVIRSLGKRG